MNLPTQTCVIASNVPSINEFANSKKLVLRLPYSHIHSQGKACSMDKPQAWPLDEDQR